MNKEDIMRSIKEGGSIPIDDDVFKQKIDEKEVLTDHQTENSFDQQYQDYVMDLQKFRIFQLETLYHDESIDRSIRLLLADVMRRVMKGDDIDTDVIFKPDPTQYLEARQKLKNEEVVRQVEKILTSGVPKEDSLDGYIPPKRHLLSQDQKTTTRRLERGDKEVLRQLRLFLLEAQYSMFLKQAGDARTDETREAMYKHISDLSINNADLWTEFYESLQEDANIQNAPDRFDYYDSMYERAQVLTEKEQRVGLNVAEKYELKTKVETLVWTMIRKAKRSGRGIHVYLSNEIQKLYENLKLQDEQFNKALLVKRLREEVVKAEAERDRKRKIERRPEHGYVHN